MTVGGLPAPVGTGYGSGMNIVIPLTPFYVTLDFDPFEVGVLRADLQRWAPLFGDVRSLAWAVFGADLRPSEPLGALVRGATGWW